MVCNFERIHFSFTISFLFSVRQNPLHLLQAKRISTFTFSTFSISSIASLHSAFLLSLVTAGIQLDGAKNVHRSLQAQCESKTSGNNWMVIAAQYNDGVVGGARQSRAGG